MWEGIDIQEEEEAVFIRGVNTNEDSPNAQHAPQEGEAVCTRDESPPLGSKGAGDHL